MRAAFAAILMAFASSAGAQATKACEDADVGVRLSIPADWECRSRDRDVFVNCAPKNERSGRPGCYFTISSRKAGKTITDEDRKKWTGWATADGSRPPLSKDDVKVAGFPTYNVVYRNGNRADSTTGSRFFVLLPGKERMLDISYDAINDVADYERYKPAVMKALQTLAPTK